MRRQLSFGPFTLDADARQLVHGSDRRHVHLSPKAFDLLTLLAEARPRAISKQELRDRLWPSTFVSEATLASVVAEVRDALGERGREGRYVRTVTGSVTRSSRRRRKRRRASTRSLAAGSSVTGKSRRSPTASTLSAAITRSRSA
jgi:DNA-binding winged helix-turn-helix (wHTH) protein